MPEQRENPPFPLVVRGYDRVHVDEHVRQLGVALKRARTRAEEAEERSTRPGAGALHDLGPQVSRLLEVASNEADQVRTEADRYAEQVRGEADQYAEQVRGEVDEEARVVRGQVQQAQDEATTRHDAMLADAQSRAEELLVRTQRHADQRAQEAVQAAEDEVEDLSERVERLWATHEQLVAGVRSSAERVLMSAQPLAEPPLHTEAGRAAQDRREVGARA